MKENLIKFEKELPSPVSEEDLLIARVYSTLHYEKFTFLSENRKTDHVKALVKSFKERDVINAILCNEKYEIIDGQNRFLARKEMGLPIIYYCVSGLDIYDVAFLNSYAKNWSSKDFVEMWADLGKEEYKTIKSFSENFKELGLTNCLMILSLSVASQVASVGSDSYVERSKRRGGDINKLKMGLFKIVDIERSTFIANSIMQYKPFTTVGVPIFRQTAFVSAMMRLLRDNKFDNAEMVRRATMYPQLFTRCVNGEGYILMLEKLYNYNRKGKRIRFEY